MAAAATDLLQEVGIATATTLDANYTINDTSITVASTSGWPTATGVTFAIDVVDSAGVQVAGTYNEYVGVVSSATSITSVDHVNGTDRNYSAGATTRVMIVVTAERENRIVEWGTVQHKQSGAHADTITTNTINENTAANGVTIDGLNIKDSKLVTADSVVTTNITADAVTATKIDWASTGADGGIWWEELGRTTLGVAGDTMSITTVAARKHLKIIVIGIPSGAIDMILRFNNDSASNYAVRTATNDSADVGGPSAVGISINPDSAATLRFATVEVMNISTQEKLAVVQSMTANTAGAGNTPTRRTTVGKWANTSDQITRVDVVNLGAGDFAAGSEVVVLGHN